ncbi:MAG: hypothetical protein C0497_12890 [Gemmatimonas sp.]|nr:hypothetical protein [Gemmatimonas sp.]
MIIVAFRCLARQLVVISGALVVVAGLVWLTADRAAALRLLETGVVDMNGLWVWTLGYGLASFVTTQGRRLSLDVDGVLEPSNTIADAVKRINAATWHRSALRYTVPITLIGAVLTAGYGLPGGWVAATFTYLAVCSIYYVGGFLLFHFVEVILSFHTLLERQDDVQFRRVYSPIHLENLTNYLAITTALGIAGIYAGFRGTLTAPFAIESRLFMASLTAPLILFLPGTLLYNYYPRYVLRKILQYKVFNTMQRLGGTDDPDARTLVIELRENAVLNSQILPFLDYKSLPSYLLAVFFALSLAFNNDPTVRAFVLKVLGTPAP